MYWQKVLNGFEHPFAPLFIGGGGGRRFICHKWYFYQIVQHVKYYLPWLLAKIGPYVSTIRHIFKRQIFKYISRFNKMIFRESLESGIGCYFRSECHMATGFLRDTSIWFQWLSGVPFELAPMSTWPTLGVFPAVPTSATVIRSVTFWKEGKDGEKKKSRTNNYIEELVLVILIDVYKGSTDCPNKNASRIFGISNFQIYESIWICFRIHCILSRTPSDLVQ